MKTTEIEREYLRKWVAAEVERTRALEEIGRAMRAETVAKEKMEEIEKQLGGVFPELKVGGPSKHFIVFHRVNPLHTAELVAVQVWRQSDGAVVVMVLDAETLAAAGAGEPPP